MDKRYKIYKLNGEHRNGTWKRKKVIKRFDNFNDFSNYLLQNDNEEIFGITKYGLISATTAAIRTIKK